jgi:hypothetical protein
MNKKIINASNCEYNNITFRSKLECSIYKYLLSVGIAPLYEPVKYKIWDNDKFTIPYFDRYGKKFQKILRKPTAITYTPDFVFIYKSYSVILEVKGFKNDVTPYKIKLFRSFLEQYAADINYVYAVVYSIKDVKLLLDSLSF